MMKYLKQSILLAGVAVVAMPAAAGAQTIRTEGSEIANFHQSFSMLGVRHNGMIEDARDCEVPAVDGDMLACTGGNIRVFGLVDLANIDNNGNSSGSEYNADQWTAMVGVDATVSDMFSIGGSLAYIDVANSFDNGGEWDADGYQVGAFAGYDTGTFYIRAVGNYSWFDADGDRTLRFGPLTDSVTGSTDITSWTVGAHAGYRFEIGETAYTPYAHIDHVNVDMDGFTESGDPEAVAYEGDDYSRTYSTLGMKFATDIGGIIAEADLGWRYRWNDDEIEIDGVRFGLDKTFASNGEYHNSYLAGVNVGGKAGNIDVRVGYQALFNNRISSHAGMLRLRVPMGGN